MHNCLIFNLIYCDTKKNKTIVIMNAYAIEDTIIIILVTSEVIVIISARFDCSVKNVNSRPISFIPKQ